MYYWERKRTWGLGKYVSMMENICTYLTGMSKSFQSGQPDLIVHKEKIINIGKDGMIIPWQPSTGEAKREESDILIWIWILQKTNFERRHRVKIYRAVNRMVWNKIREQNEEKMMKNHRRNEKQMKKERFRLLKSLIHEKTTSVRGF